MQGGRGERRQNDPATAVTEVSYAFSSLAPTARRLLEAAHRVLERDGYEGLTLRAIAAEAGETKSLIIYHFESKAGLVAHLVDFLWHDADVALRERVEQASGDPSARLEALVDLHEALARDAGAYRLYFELLPEVARDEETRRRVVAFYRAYRRFGAECIGTMAPGRDGAEPFAAALLAIGEGLPVQTLLLEDPVPAHIVFDLLRAVGRTFLGLASRKQGAGEGDVVAAAPPAWHEATSIADPTADLTPVAAEVLRAAAVVLKRDGLRSLTLDAVAEQSGEPRSSVSYHLGDKRTMLVRVLDLVDHATQQWMEGPQAPAGAEGHGGLSTGSRRALLDLDDRRAFFELLPAVLRDPDLKARQATFVEWVLARLALHAPRDGAPHGSEPVLAAAYLALVQGLAIQALVEPDTFEPLPALEAWSAAVTAWSARRVSS